MFNITPIVRNLLILNVVIFLLQDLSPNIVNWFALHPVMSDGFKPHQFVTYMFLHGNFGHLFSNMLGLFFFGPLLEQHVLGTKRFIIFYFVTGIGAGFLYAIINYIEMYQLGHAVDLYVQFPSPDAFLDFVTRFAPDFKQGALNFLNDFEDQPKNLSYINESVGFVKRLYQERLGVPMLGASGAIFGIIAAFGLIFPNMEMMLLFFPIPIKAKYFVTFYALYELYAGVYIKDSGVAHFAHIGGMIFAYILLKVWRVKRMY
ncbi:rhomboid family intramembrane serine protease [Runella sp.]|uniref:rhomboid family intramembrane serine protease n=1 Tax=Runella sp. TaxID=1960881 RepID=UPI003D1240DA